MSKYKRTQKTNSAKLIIKNTTYEFPIYKSTEGESVIDISKLHSKANVFTYDPGFTSTASCESKITYIDGDKGILRYRGYDIEELANKSDFIEENKGCSINSGKATINSAFAGAGRPLKSNR